MQKSKSHLVERVGLCLLVSLLCKVLSQLLWCMRAFQHLHLSNIEDEVKDADDPLEDHKGEKEIKLHLIN